MIEFDWLIHYKCNYRCPYCFFEGMWHEVEQRNVYLPHAAWVQAWKRMHERYGDIKIIITGGEPFVYPEFVQLLVQLSAFAGLSFDTNLSCAKEDLQELVERIDPRKVFLGLSFHPVFARVDEFMEKLRMLQEKGFSYRVHYVTYPEQLEKMKEFKDLFQRAGHRFTPIPFRGRYKGQLYPDSFTDREKECIYAVTNDIAGIDKEWANNQVIQIKSRDALCRAGQYYARVDNDGSIYPCGNDYSKSKEKFLLGNLLDNDFALHDKPMMCRQDTCPCEFRWIVKEGND